MAITANGFIAKEDDSADFITSKESEGYVAAVCRTKALIIGRRTYEVLSAQPEFQKFIEAGVRIVVVSNADFKVADVNHLVAHSPKEALSLMESFEEVVIAGGGRLNASFIEENLIDEICLDIEPAFLGKGIPLFNGGEFEKNLTFLGSKMFGEGEIQLHYEVIK